MFFGALLILLLFTTAFLGALVDEPGIFLRVNKDPTALTGPDTADTSMFAKELAGADILTNAHKMFYIHSRMSRPDTRYPFTDNHNSLWHGILGALALYFPILFPIMIVYQFFQFYDHNIVCDIFEFVIGFALAIAAYLLVARYSVVGSVI